MTTSQKKNLILGLIAAAAGAFAIYRLSTFESSAKLPSDYTVQGVCLACKAEAGLTQSVRERPPFECSSCKSKSVFPWFYCPQCKKRFVPPPEKRRDGSIGLPIVPSCPSCKATNAGNFDVLDPEQEGAPAMPVPSMPK